MLIHRKYINLVVTKKVVHKQINFTPSTVVDELVNERRRIIIFGTSTINVTVVNTNPNSALLLGHRDNIRDPVSERDRVNEPGL